MAVLRRAAEPLSGGSASTPKSDAAGPNRSGISRMPPGNARGANAAGARGASACMPGGEAANSHCAMASRLPCSTTPLCGSTIIFA